MSKGFLFGIPMGLAIIVAIALNGVSVFAPWWAAGTLLVGVTIIAFYIRRQKQHNDTNESGKKP